MMALIPTAKIQVMLMRQMERQRQALEDQYRNALTTGTGILGGGDNTIGQGIAGLGNFGSGCSGLGPETADHLNNAFSNYSSTAQADLSEESFADAYRYIQGHLNELRFGGSEEGLKKHKKAENKAVLLMQNMIGAEQCDVYRKTHRVICKPNNHFWVIGNIRDSFREDRPFFSKPDVVRVDNADRLHITYFCIDQRGENTPYTDKVITLVSHLLTDEKAFHKTGNRIKEDTLETIPECARWGI